VAALADVTETDHAYLVEVDVPGMKAEEISIETTGTGACGRVSE
jgi:HSP20 family protein